jgi:hypothetical protein
MNAFIIGLILVETLFLLLLVPVIPRFLDYHTLYLMIQESCQLSDWECFKMAFQDACSDVFDIKSDEEVDD